MARYSSISDELINKNSIGCRARNITIYKGADKNARMRRLVCACVVHKPPKTGFLASRPYVAVQCIRVLLPTFFLKSLSRI